MTAAHTPEPTVESGLPVTRDMIDAYLGDLQQKGRQQETIRTYRKSLYRFYDRLPDEKIIRKNSPLKYKELLTSLGYTTSSVNVCISAVNNFLNYCGRRDLQLIQYEKRKDYDPPRMTRAEYLHLLRTAKTLEDMRTYLLVKLFVTTDLPIQKLSSVTVDAVASGIIPVFGSEMEVFHIPQGLRGELLSYAKNQGISSGPVFCKKNGEPIDRKMVDIYIRRLCEKAGVDLAKGNPRCLKRLYQSTRSGIESQINLEALVAQLQNTMLDNEQKQIGWEQS